MKFGIQEVKGMNTIQTVEPTAKFGTFLAKCTGLLDREVHVIRLNFKPEEIRAETESALGELAVYDLFELSEEGIFTLKDNGIRMAADFIGDVGTTPGHIRGVDSFKEIIPVTPKFLEVYDL